MLRARVPRGIFERGLAKMAKWVGVEFKYAGKFFVTALRKIGRDTRAQTRDTATSGEEEASVLTSY